MLEEMVSELRRVMRFKENTDVGDIVLIAAEKPQMLVYALVSGIEADAARRGEWWHVSMQLLTVPPQNIVWTLRAPQFTGREIFTMGGEERFVQAVALDETPDREEGDRGGPSPAEIKPFRRVK